jgi:hypothetical protein
MEEYNNIVKRVWDALNFFEICTKEEYEIWFPKYQVLVKRLDLLGKDIKKGLGRELTTDEVLHGFKEAA